MKLSISWLNETIFIKSVLCILFSLIIKCDCFGQMSSKEAEFVKNCMADFHEYALLHDQAKKGIISVPEVLEVGTNECLLYFQDESLQKKYSNDVKHYYFELLKLCFESGMVYAACWHENYSIIKDGSFQKQVHQKGVHYFSKGLWQKDLEMSETAFLKFEEGLFDHWMNMVEPYLNLQDPRRYLFNGMLSAYQVGMSMELTKLGY